MGFQFMPLGLANVIDIRQNIKPARLGLGEDLHPIASLGIQYSTALSLPPLRRTEHRGLRILRHNEGDASGAVSRVVALHVQKAGICLRRGCDLPHAGVPHGGDVFPLRLPLLPALRVCGGLITDDLS